MTSKRLIIPADFSSRTLPCQTIDTSTVPLWRIHRSAHDPIWFNRTAASGARFRFDAPADEFGVLYAAQLFSVCMAETLIRDRFAGASYPLELDLSALRERSISRIQRDVPTSLLNLVDLTADMFALGADASLTTDADYSDANLWSLAIHEHPKNYDGVVYLSRYTGGTAIAIFDRVEMMARSLPTPLERAPELASFLDRYQIALL